MRSITERRRILMFGVCGLFAFGCAFGQRSERLFIAQSEGHWCAYGDLQSLEDAPKDQDPQYVVIAEAVGDRLVAVRIRRTTEDTATYDEYLVGRDGLLQELRRTFDAITDRVTREQTWKLTAGTPSKVSESWTEFKTRKAIRPDHRLDDYFEYNIITRLADFPFYSLIADPKRWTAKSPCSDGDMSKLESPLRLAK